MSGEGADIRPARTNDAVAIAELLCDLGWFDHIADDGPIETERRVVERIVTCAMGGRATVLVAEAADGQVVGYIATHWMPNLMGGLEGYVSELFVRRDSQGQGVGTRLLETIEREARQRACSRLLLFNRRTRESYQRGFYVRRGWVERDDVACFMRFLEQGGG